MIVYLYKVKKMILNFEEFLIQWLPRSNNSNANTLANLDPWLA